MKIISKTFIVILLVVSSLIRCSAQIFQSDIIDKYGLIFKLIPSGSFLMGGTENNELPIHEVAIIRPFYIGIYEVTQDQYQRVMQTEISEYQNSNIPVGVTWLEAV